MIVFQALFDTRRRESEKRSVNPLTRKSWFKRLKRQIKVTLGELKATDFKKGFIDLIRKGFAPVSAAFNSRIPTGFFLSTETPLYAR